MSLSRHGRIAAAAVVLATAAASAGAQTVASAAPHARVSKDHGDDGGRDHGNTNGTSGSGTSGPGTSGNGAPGNGTPGSVNPNANGGANANANPDATAWIWQLIQALTGRGHKPSAPKTSPAPAPAKTVAPATTPAAAEATAPAVAADTSVGHTTDGSVRVLSDPSGYQPLTTAPVPVGSVIDATNGTVSLTTALPNGKTQTAKFWGGVFTFSKQGRDGTVHIKLAGASRAGCPAAGGTASASASASASAKAKKRRKQVLRSIWAKDDHGRFRSRGRYSVATVRGTEWVTRERCDGTFTYVRKGAVDVLDRATGKTYHLRAGMGHLARG